MSVIRQVARAVIPQPARRQIGRLRDHLREQQEHLKIWPKVGFVRFGSLRRVEPIYPPPALSALADVERHYIEQFISAHIGDLRGQIVATPPGLLGSLSKSVAVAFLGNQAGTQPPRVTEVEDPNALGQMPDAQFDCMVMIHALPFVWDLRFVLGHAHRVLKPNGVLLATVPGIRPLAQAANGREDYWRFTTRTVKRLLTETFPQCPATVTSHGNVVAALALLHGMPASALHPAELQYSDPMYQLVITLRVVKSSPDT